MHLDFHCYRFDWIDSNEEMGTEVAAFPLADEAEPAPVFSP